MHGFEKTGWGSGRFNRAIDLYPSLSDYGRVRCIYNLMQEGHSEAVLRHHLGVTDKVFASALLLKVTNDCET